MAYLVYHSLKEHQYSNLQTNSNQHHSGSWEDFPGKCHSYNSDQHIQQPGKNLHTGHIRLSCMFMDLHLAGSMLSYVAIG